MSCISIISCFSYTGSRKYVFRSTHIKSDLRKILSFSHNRIGCSFDNIYIMTDIQPSKSIQSAICQDFCSKVIEYLQELGLLNCLPIEYCKDNPREWVLNICKQIISDNKAIKLYEEIMRKIILIIRNSNVIEFASLFTNLILIKGKDHYDDTLNKIFDKPISNLFFYYTGHGIKIKHSQNHEICLVIPCKTPEFYTQKELQTRFQTILNNVSSFIVFDCCHGQNLLNLNNIKHDTIYLSSTSHNQTCGFHIPDSGSLFTYYLIKFLNKYCSKSLSELQHIESQIQHYRKLHNKEPQNISMTLSNQNITHFPHWLFKESRTLLLEEDD